MAFLNTLIEIKAIITVAINKIRYDIINSAKFISIIAKRVGITKYDVNGNNDNISDNLLFPGLLITVMFRKNAIINIIIGKVITVFISSSLLTRDAHDANKNISIINPVSENINQTNKIFVSIVYSIIFNPSA